MIHFCEEMEIYGKKSLVCDNRWHQSLVHEKWLGCNSFFPVHHKATVFPVSEINEK